MRSLTLSTLLTCTLAGALSAQITYPTAYPQMGTDSSSGQIVPLGEHSSLGNWDEGRWHEVIPARYLPSSGGAIFALDVLSQASLSVTYTSLTITFSHLPPGTPLNSTFASNLPAPIVVYSHAPQTITWVARQWQSIPLDQPFIYDGVSDLVVEIQKVCDRLTNPPTGLAHHQTTGNPGRTDLPSARFAYGQFGSGAATALSATAATRPLKMRFQFMGLPTLTLTAQRGGANSKVFAINDRFDATVHGPTGALYGALISFGWLPRPLPIPGIGGSILIDVTTASAYTNGTIGATGEETVTWTVPNDPGLVGALLTFQGISQDANSNLTLTNATDCYIND